MVLSSAILNFFAGGTFFYGFTVFFNPIRETFNWTAATTSIAFVFQRLEAGVLGPISGFLVDRVGPRKLMIPGWIITGLGFLWMSRIDSLWSFYGSFVLIATGLSLGSFVVMNATIANWFTRKRSRALTFIYVGFGLSGLLVPLVSLFISQFGWRESLVVIGFTMWAIGIPLSLLMRHKPSQYGYLPDGEIRARIEDITNEPSQRSSKDRMEQDSGYIATGFTVREALRTRAFWLLSFVFFFQHIGTSAVMVHIVPYLESVKVPGQIAALSVTGMTVCSLIGRLGFGLLGDFKNKRYLIAISLTLQAIGLFIFSLINADRVWLIIPFLLTYSPGYGGPIPLRPALQGDYFGTKNFGTIMGLMLVITMMGGLISPVFAGWVFDTMGGYQSAWQIFALTTLPAIFLVLLAIPPKSKAASY